MPDASRLEVLRKLREMHQMSQADVASYFGFKGRNARITISRWESGMEVPAHKHRAKFINYLIDRLELRISPELFEQVWNILSIEWRWLPLTEGERQQFIRPTERLKATADDQVSFLPTSLPQKDDQTFQESVTCPDCGLQFDTNIRYCDQCGADLQATNIMSIEELLVKDKKITEDLWLLKQAQEQERHLREQTFLQEYARVYSDIIIPARESIKQKLEAIGNIYSVEEVLEASQVPTLIINIPVGSLDARYSRHKNPRHARKFIVPSFSVYAEVDSQSVVVQGNDNLGGARNLTKRYKLEKLTASKLVSDFTLFVARLLAD